MMGPLELDVKCEQKKMTKMWDDETQSNPPLYLYEIDDVSIVKDSYPNLTREYSRRIGGPSFFISVYESQFYHFLVDGLAQFLWLKTFIPDIKVYFVNDQPSAILDRGQIPKDFVRDVISWCQEEEGFGGEIVNISTYRKMKIDKLFSLANSNVTFLRDYLGIENSKVTGDVSNSDGARQLLLPLLKEFLYKKALQHNRLPKDFNYPNRVFIRPGLTIERLNAWLEQVEYLREKGVVFNNDLEVVEDPENVLETLGELEGWEHKINLKHMSGIRNEVSHRHLTKEDVQALDNFFLRREYEFLDSQKMAWIDILNMIIRAEKVAFVAGAAILNALVADEKAQIIYLDCNTKYSFNHLATLELFFKDPEPFIYLDRRLVATKKFKMSRVLDELENEKGHYL